MSMLLSVLHTGQYLVDIVTSRGDSTREVFDPTNRSSSIPFCMATTLCEVGKISPDSLRNFGACRASRHLCLVPALLLTVTWFFEGTRY
jgi:hypothetical protein